MTRKTIPGTWSASDFTADMARLGFTKWVQLASYLGIDQSTVRAYAYGRLKIPERIQTTMQQASQFDPAVRSIIAKSSIPRVRRRYFPDDDLTTPAKHPPYLFTRSQYELVIEALKAWGKRLEHPDAERERGYLAKLVSQLPKHVPYRVPVDDLTARVLGSALFNLGRTNPRALALYQLWRRNFSTGAPLDRKFVDQWRKDNYGF